MFRRLMINVLLSVRKFCNNNRLNVLYGRKKRYMNPLQ